MLDYSQITAEMLTKEVITLGEEYPNAVYDAEAVGDKCSYVQPRTGPGNGCIFGQALQNLGVKVDELEFFDKQYFTDSSEIRTLSSYLRITGFDSRWDLVQKNQDRGVPWGRAIRVLTE